MCPFNSIKKRREYEIKRYRTIKRKMDLKASYERNKEKNKEHRREYRKIYYIKNRERIIKKVKEYYKDHKARLLLQRKGWRRKKKCRSLGLSELAYSELTKECAICGFKELVDLHHIDNNRENASIDNLIGLCPNHHFLIHRKNKDLSKEINQAIKRRDIGNGFFKT